MSDSENSLIEEENLEDEIDASCASQESEADQPLKEGQVKQIQAIISDSNGDVKARIIIFGESEETSYLLKQKKAPIFPKKYYNSSLSFQKMTDEFKQALGTGEIKYHWMHSMEMTDLLFVNYESVRGWGCAHYVTNMFFQCKDC